jgi:predicted nucleotidyltransferase
MNLLVETIVNTITRSIPVKKIVLFGLLARGNPHPESDVDLLIIYDGELSKREVKLQIHHLFPHRDFSMDIFVLRPDEFEQQKNIVSTVSRTASLEGVVYYESIKNILNSY